MTKTNKLLILILVLILVLLIIVSSVLGVYLWGLNLYKKMNFDPNADFAVTVDRNQAFMNAYDKLIAGVPIEEVIKDSELTPEQIEVLIDYANGMEIDPEYTGSGTVSDVKPPVIVPPMASDGIINIMFLGTDERPGEKTARSDSMIVVTINTQTKEIIFTSLMRDMYIELVGMDRNDRLNAAYRFGGVQMLNDTIKKYLGIETENYVRVNFDSFETIIDQIGGVDVPFNDNTEVRNAEIKRLKNFTDFSTDQLVQGTEYTYHLSGIQALYYCRDRYSGNTVKGFKGADFGRTERQRKVLSSIVKKAQGMGLTDLLDAMPEILALVTTDLTFDDCTNLLLSVGTSYSNYTIKNFRIPADNTWKYATTAYGASVIEVDYEENARLWKEFVYGE